MGFGKKGKTARPVVEEKVEEKVEEVKPEPKKEVAKTAPKKVVVPPLLEVLFPRGEKVSIKECEFEVEKAHGNTVVLKRKGVK